MSNQFQFYLWSKDHRLKISLLLQKAKCFFVGLLSIIAALCITNSTYAQGSPKFKVIAFYNASYDAAHISFANECNTWFPQAAAEYGFEYTSTKNWGNLNTSYLANYDVVLFLDDQPPVAQRAQFEQYMRNGGAWMGFHVCAFNTDPNSWDWYFNQFLGMGAFVSNTWFPTTAVLDVENHTHTATKNLPNKFTSAVSEWYSWRVDLRTKSNIDILCSVNPESFPLGTDPNQTWYSGYYPIVWSNKNYKMIYNNFGHNLMNYSNNTDLSNTFTVTEQNQLVIESLFWLADVSLDGSTPGQSPYSGSPINLPGTVQVENFDNGGEGIAYHDLTAVNSGGQYRTEGVDIEVSNEGGFNVGWTGAGEWLEYTVNIAQAGNYDFGIRNASEQSGTLRIEIDGQNVTGTVNIPTTGGWQTWSTINAKNIPLSAGTKVMRIYVISGEFNLNYLNITQSPQIQTPYSGSPINIPGMVQIENYDKGGEGIAFHDLTTTNEGGQYRSDAVDIQVCSEGGYNVGWTAASEWLEYAVNVSQSGNYDFNIRVASTQSSTLRIELDGQNVTGTVNAAATGGWQTWTTVSAKNIALTAGTKVMRLFIVSGGLNLNYVNILQNTSSNQTPYNGSPISLPGVVQAENYDKGGEGIAFHDLTATNEGGQYRTDAVDIEACSEGGYNVGWTGAGEWLEYAINITQSGNYDFNIRVASTQASTLRIELDGQNVTGTVNAAATGGWQSWTTVSAKKIALTAGIKTMRVFVVSGGFNLNFIEAIQSNLNSNFKVVGYFPSWAGSTSDIQYDKLTHINYAFIRPTTSGGLTAVDNVSKLTALVASAHAQNTKVGMAIGGWSDLNNSDFETMAANANTRTAFINNVMGLMNQYNLDGVDIDWEYPIAATANNYDLLMHGLAQALHAQGKYLTAAVIGLGDYYGQYIHNAVFADVDFLNIMAYDGGTPHASYAFAQSCISYWIGRGLPANKLVIGVPFYGRSSTEYVGYNTLLTRDPNAYNKDVVNGVEYNGIPTIKAKTQYALDNLGGIMIWEISQDVTGSKSLLSAIHDQIQANGSARTIPFDEASIVKEKQLLSLAPNPANNQIKLNGLTGKAEIRIIDIKGTVMMNLTSDGALPIDISSLSKGMYLIKVAHEGRLETLKLVK